MTNSTFQQQRLKQFAGIYNDGGPLAAVAPPY